MNDEKIRWIVQQKKKGRGSREIAEIQHVTLRWVKRLWQLYRQSGVTPALKKPGRPARALSLGETAIISDAYKRHRTNALTLEKITKHQHGVRIPHNGIHGVLRLNGMAMPDPAKQRRRRWVRYERVRIA